MLSVISQSRRAASAYCTRMAELYREYGACKDCGEFGTSPATQSMRLTIEAAVRVHEALADWARWAEEHSPTPGEPSFRAKDDDALADED